MSESYRDEPSEISKLRVEVIETARNMKKEGLVKASWGNVSAHVPQSNIVVITPSGLEYDRLKPEDMVVIDLEGKVLEGHYKPSIETPMHTTIYRYRPDVHAIVHTHSPFATAFAVANRELPPFLADQAAVIGGTVEVVEYATPGTVELAEKVASFLSEKTAVLLQNHGVVAVGLTLKEAFNVACTVEEAAFVHFIASVIGKPVRLPEKEVLELYKFYKVRYGQT